MKIFETFCFMKKVFIMTTFPAQKFGYVDSYIFPKILC